MASSLDEILAEIWGTYPVPSLAYVHGTIEFAGPLSTVYAEIDDGKVTLKPHSDHVDCVLRTDQVGMLLALVRGQVNPITAAIRGDIGAEGDLSLALEVAGSMRELGKQLADLVASKTQGGEPWPANP